MKTNKVTPHNVHVLAEVVKLPSEEDGIYVGGADQMTMTNVQYYYGKALSIGNQVNTPEQCPEVKPGDGIIFSQIAGSQITTDDVYCKIIRGHAIVALYTDLKNMNKETIKPTGDRILVEIIGEKLINEGIYDSSKSDPRENATQRGVVISCGASAEKIAPGTIVAFDPFCGNMIVNEKDMQLKTVNSFDILFSLPGQ
jgi:co-chaperonin GroES (HSP10)